MQWVHVMWPTKQIKVKKFYIVFYYLFPRHIFWFANIFNISEKLFNSYLFWIFELGHQNLIRVFLMNPAINAQTLHPIIQGQNFSHGAIKLDHKIKCIILVFHTSQRYRANV